MYCERDVVDHSAESVDQEDTDRRGSQGPLQVSDGDEDYQELGETPLMLLHGNYSGCYGSFLSA